MYVTVALLVVGALQVGNGFATFGRLPQFLNQYYEAQGVGAYSNAQLASSVGVAIMVSQALIFLGTLWVSYRALKRRRLGFYWPLVGFAAAMLVTIVLMIVAMMGDPALIAYLQRQQP